MKFSTTILLLAVTPLFSQGRKPDLENDQVRVLVVTEQPHVKTSLHKHDVNRVMIYLNAGRQEFVSEGKKSEVVYKAGEAKWSPAGGLHTAELMSGEPMKIVEVEIKKPGDPAKVIAPITAVGTRCAQASVAPTPMLPKVGMPEAKGRSLRSVFVVRVKVRT